MLWWTLHTLAQVDADEVVIVINPKIDDGDVREIAADAGVRSAACVVQEPQLGTGHAAQVALAAFAPRESAVLIVSADMPLVEADLLRRTLEARDGALAMVTARMPLPSSFGRVVRSGGQVERIVEARDAAPDELALDEMNAAIYAFDEYKLRGALDRLDNKNAQNEYYLTDTIAHLRSAGESVKPVIAADYRTVLGVNDRVELAAARERLNLRLCEAHMKAGVTIVDPAVTYLEPGIEIGQDVILHPNTSLERGTRIGKGSEIGPNARLRDAWIGEHVVIADSVVTDSEIGDFSSVGPFAHVRGETVLGTAVRIGNFVETKNAKLAPGVRAAHLAYLGDAVIGKNSNIGAGTITCNYDGRDKHTTEIGENVFIGSNSSLIAPLEIGDGAMTGAGSVVTRDVPEGERVAGNPARPLPKKSAAP
jgi:bifunctional UDP-N-acetylglucosamine pyrophosphorylase/glucosamine-1-phosphate N-acetyltransferase